MEPFIDRLIKTARSQLSQETGWIHIFHSSMPDEKQDSIPILENLLFALALFRARSQDQFNEAKAIVEKILPFQNLYSGENEGNFPIYIHSYPQCHHRYHSIDLALPFYWIIKEWGTLLGSELRNKVTSSIEKLLKHANSTIHDETPLHFKIKHAAVANAFSVLRQDKSQLFSLEQFKEPFLTGLPTLSSSNKILDVLFSLETVIPNLNTSPWSPLVDWIRNSFNPALGLYLAPRKDLFFYGHSPLFTSYEALLQSECEKEHPLSDPRILFLLALHFPQETHLFEDKKGNDSSWLIQNRKTVLDQSQEQGLTPLAYFTQTSSLTVETAPQVLCTSRLIDNGALLECSFNEDLASSEREESKELCLFFTRSPASEIFVDGNSSTTFLLGQTIHLENDTGRIGLKFTLAEGAGKFLGHISFGNRSSQKHLKGTRRFDAYDWRICLRTLSRSSPCKILVEISVV